jgi:hypothetical protein
LLQIASLFHSSHQSSKLWSAANCSGRSGAKQHQKPSSNRFEGVIEPSMCRERIEQYCGSLKLGACGRDGTFKFRFWCTAWLGASALPSLPRIFLAGERRRGPRQRRRRRTGWMNICRTDVKVLGDEFLMSTWISAIRLPTLIHPHSTLF